MEIITNSEMHIKTMLKNIYQIHIKLTSELNKWKKLYKKKDIEYEKLKSLMEDVSSTSLEIKKSNSFNLLHKDVSNSLNLESISSKPTYKQDFLNLSLSPTIILNDQDSKVYKKEIKTPNENTFSKKNTDESPQLEKVFKSISPNKSSYKCSKKELAKDMEEDKNEIKSLDLVQSDTEMLYCSNREKERMTRPAIVVPETIPVEFFSDDDDFSEYNYSDVGVKAHENPFIELAINNLKKVQGVSSDRVDELYIIGNLQKFKSNKENLSSDHIENDLKDEIIMSDQRNYDQQKLTEIKSQSIIPRIETANVNNCKSPLIKSKNLIINKYPDNILNKEEEFNKPSLHVLNDFLSPMSGSKKFFSLKEKINKTPGKSRIQEKNQLNYKSPSLFEDENFFGSNSDLKNINNKLLSMNNKYKNINNLKESLSHQGQKKKIRYESYYEKINYDSKNKLLCNAVNLQVNNLNSDTMDVDLDETYCPLEMEKINKNFVSEMTKNRQVQENEQSNLIIENIANPENSKYLSTTFNLNGSITPDVNLSQLASESFPHGKSQNFFSNSKIFTKSPSLNIKKLPFINNKSSQSNFHQTNSNAVNIECNFNDINASKNSKNNEQSINFTNKLNNENNPNDNSKQKKTTDFQQKLSLTKCETEKSLQKAEFNVIQINDNKQDTLKFETPLKIKLAIDDDEKDFKDCHSFLFDDSFDRLPKKYPSKIPNKQEYAYVDVVRKKDERKKLEAYTCIECQKWFDSMKLTEEERHERMKSCRHRARHIPSCTPDHYWSLGFPDTQKCIDRGFCSSPSSSSTSNSHPKPLLSR